jgi:hypothetical protein
MVTIVEQSAEWQLARVAEVLGENLPQRHFVHHKSHDITCDCAAFQWEAGD